MAVSAQQRRIWLQIATAVRSRKIEFDRASVWASIAHDGIRNLPRPCRGGGAQRANTGSRRPKCNGPTTRLCHRMANSRPVAAPHAAGGGLRFWVENSRPNPIFRLVDAQSAPIRAPARSETPSPKDTPPWPLRWNNGRFAAANPQIAGVR